MDVDRGISGGRGQVFAGGGEADAGYAASMGTEDAIADRFEFEMLGQKWRRGGC